MIGNHQSVDSTAKVAVAPWSIQALELVKVNELPGASEREVVQPPQEHPLENGISKMVTRRIKMYAIVCWLLIVVAVVVV